MDPTPDMVWANAAYTDGATRDYLTARAYYSGQHPLTFAGEKFKRKFGQQVQAFADNLCRIVVDGPVDRMRWRDLVPMGPGADAPAAAAAAARAGALLDLNRMDRRRTALLRAALRDGDVWMAVEPREGASPRMVTQAPEMVRARTEPDDVDGARLAVVAKTWMAGSGGSHWRRTLIYPDRMERYVAEAGAQTDAPTVDGAPTPAPSPPTRGWEPYVGADDPDADLRAQRGGAAHVIPKPQYQGRVPWFRLSPLDGATPDRGRSVLYDVAPLQDALNKSVADLLVAMEANADPLRYALGITPERDDAGREVPLVSGPGDWLHSPNAQATIGQLPPGAMDPYLEVSETFRTEIARIGNLPLWWVVPSSTGQPPSGEALKVGEARLTAFVANIASLAGDWFEDMVTYALQVDQGPGAVGPVPVDVRLEARWQPFGTVDEQAVWDLALAKQAAGVTRVRSLVEAGYDQAVAEQMVEDAVAEQGQLVDQRQRALAAGAGTFGLG